MGNQEREAARRVMEARSMPERWQALKKFYQVVDIEHHEGYPGGIDWLSLFTPIEFLAWQDIRHFGLPLWPQYPAAGVFFDFADPLKKIAVECDGKQWHDAEADAARDKRVEKAGWSVYRVGGAECYRSDDELLELIGEPDYDEAEYARLWKRYTEESSTALFKALAILFYNKAPSRIMSFDDADRVLDIRRTNADNWGGAL